MYVRPALRGTAVVCGLLLLAGVLASTNTASAAASRVPAAIAAKAATPATNPASNPASNLAAKGNPWAPSRNYVPWNGARFGYLKRGRANQARIRAAVLATIQSTWGGPRDRYGLPLATNGKIRIATWSFGDKGIARALVAARNR